MSTGLLSKAYGRYDLRSTKYDSESIRTVPRLSYLVPSKSAKLNSTTLIGHWGVGEIGKLFCSKCNKIVNSVPNP
jgi:hypothetical protein